MEKSLGKGVEVDAVVLPEELREQLKTRRLTMLVGSDLHGSAGGFEWFCAQAVALGPELVVFLGDFITGKPLSFLVEALRDLRNLAPNCYVIPGNWDPREALPLLDTEAFDGMRHLHKHTAFLGGYSFAGLGGSTTTPVGTTPLEMPDEVLAAPLPSLLPADIWLVHNPLRGYRDETAAGAHAGSEELARIYREQDPAPRLVLSGHIHEARGRQDEGPTVFVNPGTLAERQAAWVVLDGEETTVELLEG